MENIPVLFLYPHFYYRGPLQCSDSPVLLSVQQERQQKENNTQNVCMAGTAWNHLK